MGGGDITFKFRISGPEFMTFCVTTAVGMTIEIITQMFHHTNFEASALNGIEHCVMYIAAHYLNPFIKHAMTMDAYMM